MSDRPPTKKGVSHSADEDGSAASGSSAKKLRTADADEEALPAAKLDSSPEAFPARASLTALPFEMLFAIASFFGEREIMNVSRACKTTHEAISQLASRPGHRSSACGGLRLENEIDQIRISGQFAACQSVATARARLCVGDGARLARRQRSGPEW